MTSLPKVYSAEGRYAESAALLCEALDKERRAPREDHPFTAEILYSLGCVAARRGDRREALDWLGQAGAHGYSNADSLAQIDDLKRLRGQPAFEALVSRARKNAGNGPPATAGLLRPPRLLQWIGLDEEGALDPGKPGRKRRPGP